MPVFSPFTGGLTNILQRAKKNINYDKYTNRSLRYQYHKMEATIEMVKEREMPLKSYKWTHRDARLTDEEQSKITGWAQSIMDMMKVKYPIDSLVRKK